jgi:hypothetical protein
VVELNLSPHANHCKMERFSGFPKQVPMMRDLKSIRSSGFHPLLTVRLVKKSNEETIMASHAIPKNEQKKRGF